MTNIVESGCVRFDYSTGLTGRGARRYTREELLEVMVANGGTVPDPHNTLSDMWGRVLERAHFLAKTTVGIIRLR